MKSHRAAWKDRREFRAATAWWSAYGSTPARPISRPGIIKLNAVMSPRTDTLLKLFEKEQHDAAKAQREQVARAWNEKLKAAGPVKKPARRKLTSDTER
jgi:hypothetical protein